MLAGMVLDVAGADGSSGIPMQVIDAGEILEKIQKGEPVEYDHVMVRGELDLSRERLKKNITTPIRITGSIFDSLVSFNGTTLEMSVDLSDSNFTRDAYFRGSKFTGGAYFDIAAFSGFADFEGAEFSADADFWMTMFTADADFGEATFSGEDANFNWAAFSRFVDFEGATFNSDASFFMAKFRVVDFGWARFNGNADFRRARFKGDTNFLRATFNRDADFSLAALTGNASFYQAEFNGDNEFGSAVFRNDTEFYRIFFKRPAYFEDCSIENLNLTRADFGRLHLRWGDIKSLHFDEAAYLALIKNYNNLGWYGDANWCYYDYRNAVRKNWMAASSPGFAARLSNLLDWLIDYVEWILYGYGVRPSFPIAWSVVIILAFGLFFWQKGCLRKIIVEERIEDSKEKSDEVLIKTTARKAEINSLDPFLFSLFTFTSGFTSFLHPTIEYKLERCMRWAIFERLLGPFFLALVITAISKTYLMR